ncbi:hypothetical protein KOPIIPEJ_03237 [Aeromonas dhakensis]
MCLWRPWPATDHRRIKKITRGLLAFTRYGVMATRISAEGLFSTK